MLQLQATEGLSTTRPPIHHKVTFLPLTLRPEILLTSSFKKTNLMKPTPVLFFAFANEEGRFLNALKEESSAIYKILHPLENTGKLLVVREESANSEELFVTFRRFKERMLIFHFAGHAGSNLLGLEDLQADATALAPLFEEQRNTLKLVFLNGCATRGQVNRLQQLGIKAVIATSRPVQDQSALFFAETFYAALAGGQYSLREAFTHARTALATRFQKAANQFRGIDTFGKDGGRDFAWGLYAAQEDDLDWKIGDPFLPISELRKASLERYGELRQGAFRYLRIEDALLRDKAPEEKPDIIPIIVALDQENLQLENAVRKLWPLPRPHAILTGKGGMGKTVSLDYLWQYFLGHVNPDKGTASDPIPLYLSVEEINEWGDNRNSTFIREQLRELYYIENLKDFLGDNISQGPPNVLLLLDGLHYVGLEKVHGLIEEITLLSNPTSFPNLQIILTAHEDPRQRYTTENWPSIFRLIELQPLSPLDIRKYLGDAVPLNAGLNSLLSNPMMLTLFKASMISIEQTDKTPFKTDITKAGELLFNVELMTLQSIRSKQAKNPGEITFQRFILEHLLPWIAWTMYKANIPLISRKENPEINLRSLLPKALSELLSEDFFDTFDRDFDRYLDETKFADLPPRQLFNRIIRDVSIEKLALLIEENDGVRFLHNLFRDYFAARHILNQIDLGLKRGALPLLLCNTRLEAPLCRMIGEIEGEHFHNPATSDLHPMWASAALKPNRIARALELCRGNFREQSLGFALQNLLRIMILSRGELSGANLQMLDLRKIELNGIRLARWNKQPLRANLFGAIIGHKTFFQGMGIFRKKVVCLSPNRQRILFAAGNGDMLEWTTTAPFTCIRAFSTGLRIKDVQYAGDGNRLFIFTEKDILEWDLFRLCILKQYHPDNLPAENIAPRQSPDTSLLAKVNRIRNLPGLFFQGCDFSKLHPDSQLDPQMRRQIQRHGGIFTDEDAQILETALPRQGAR